MTPPSSVKKIIDSCPESSCIRCRHCYIEDRWDFTEESLANLNLSCACMLINPDQGHVASHVRQKDTCKSFVSASVILIYPARTKSMQINGKFWTDEMREKSTAKMSKLDRWV